MDFLSVNENGKGKITFENGTFVSQRKQYLKALKIKKTK